VSLNEQGKRDSEGKSTLKRELDGILELITENEIKAQGLRVIEYAFLLSESLEDIR